MKNNSLYRRWLFYVIAIFPVNGWLYSNKKMGVGRPGFGQVCSKRRLLSDVLLRAMNPPPPQFEYSWRFDTLHVFGKLVVPVTEQYTIHGKTRAVFISTTVIACYPVLPDCIHVGYLMAFFPTMWFFDLLRGNTFPVPLYGPK